MVTDSSVTRKAGLRADISTLTLVVFCCVALVAAAASQPAHAATLDVPSPAYPTIQSAIDAAVDLDTVQVAAGTYYERLTWIAKDIDLLGAGAGATIVDGQNTGRCLYVLNVPETATVSGFTFTHGSAPEGAGLFLDNSSPRVTDNTISDNTVSNRGGGLFLYQSSSALTGNVITRNSADVIGGGVCLLNSSATMEANTITDNSAIGGRGGGVYIGGTSSSPALNDNLFEANSANYGGAIYVAFVPSLTMANNLLTQNTAPYGAGLYLYDVDGTLTNDTIALNVGVGVLGALGGDSSVSITNAVLWGNTVADLSGVPATYSDIGTGDTTGAGNISANPMFIGGGDFHLQDGSPCIDAADSLAPGLPLTDKDGNPRIVGGVVDMGAFEWQGPSLLEVAIDIKPGSDPNTINNDGRGVIPVAVLSSGDFDVSLIRVDTVQLEGMAIKVVGKADKMLYHYEDVNADGCDDLVLQIQDADAAFDVGTVTATLTGELWDGTPIVGQDDIVIVPPN